MSQLIPDYLEQSRNPNWESPVNLEFLNRNKHLGYLVEDRCRHDIAFQWRIEQKIFADSSYAKRFEKILPKLYSKILSEKEEKTGNCVKKRRDSVPIKILEYIVALMEFNKNRMIVFSESDYIIIENGIEYIVTDDGLIEYDPKIHIVPNSLKMTP